MIDTQAIRNKILDLALRGKLTEQLPEDGTAEELCRKIQQEKEALITSGKIKREKPYSTSPVFFPYPFEIPDNWQFIRFGDLMINRDSERIPVSVADRRKRGKIYDYYGASGVIDKIDSYLFDKDLLLIGEDGANLLARSTPIAFIASGKYWVNNHAHVLDVCAGVELRYICYYINAISLTQYITGSAQPKMNQENMNAIWIALPPLAEQKRIIEKIQQAFSILNTVDALQTQYHDNLSILKSKLIDAGIQGKLTEQLPEDGTAEELYQQIQQEKQALEKAGKIKKSKPLPPVSDEEKPFDIPENWKWIRLKELGVFSGGKTPSMANHEYWDKGDILWITSKDMKRKYISASEMMITKQAAQDMTIYPENTVLFVVRSGILRRLFPVAILKDKGTINQDLKAIELYIHDMHEYVYYLLKGLEKTILFQYTKDGTTVNNIVFDSMLSMPLPLPPLAEQKRIVAKLEELLPLCEG